MAELESINAGQKENAPSNSDNNEAMTEEVLNEFNQDPVGFIQRVVNNSAETYLTNLKDEAELNGALKAIRREKPNFVQFENFILQEVAELIQNDEDGIIDPWQDLLEKGYEQFKVTFQEAVKNDPELLKQLQSNALDHAKKPMESNSVRQKKQTLPSFTRKQIAKMSPEEFRAVEGAIDLALQQNRIL